MHIQGIFLPKHTYIHIYIYIYIYIVKYFLLHTCISKVSFYVNIHIYILVRYDHLPSLCLFYLNSQDPEQLGVSKVIK